MRAVEPAADTALEDYPEFDLRYRYDDPAAPTAVTVYPLSGFDDITTAWLSIDAEHAVAVEELR